MRARDYFDHISCGYEGGVERPDDEGKDRRLRELINDANKKGDCIISARGRYYRPRMYLEEEAYEAKRYFASELHRARDILFKRMKMIEASKISRRDIWGDQRERKGSAESANSPVSSGITDIRVEEDSSFPGQMVMRM